MKMRKLTYFKIQSVFQLYFDDEGLINHTKDKQKTVTAIKLEILRNGCCALSQRNVAADTSILSTNRWLHFSTSRQNMEFSRWLSYYV